MITKKKKTCPSCGDSMKYESRSDEVTYKGHSKTFTSTGWWCTSCDEAIFEGAELEKAEKAFVELRAEVEQVLLPKQIAKIREQLNLSQREAGKILGGGPRAFQKYEAGAVPVSAPMNNLLLLLGEDPQRLQELRSLQAKIASVLVSREAVSGKRANPIIANVVTGGKVKGAVHSRAAPKRTGRSVA